MLTLDKHWEICRKLILIGFELEFKRVDLQIFDRAFEFSQL
jgi:hypothetical protein